MTANGSGRWLRLLALALLTASVAGLVLSGAADVREPGRAPENGPTDPSARQQDYILSGDERDHITDKGWTEVGEIHLSGNSYLDATDNSIIKIQGEITLRDKSQFEIYSKGIHINGDITLYNDSVINIYLENIKDNDFLLLNGTITAYGTSGVNIIGYSRVDEQGLTRLVVNKRMTLADNSSFAMSNIKAQLRSPVKMRDGSFFWMYDDSNATWDPNIDLGQYEPLLNLSGNARFEVEDSSLYINPPNWTNNPDPLARYNANYLYTDGDSEVSFKNSHFAVILPGNVIEEAYHVTAGTILVTGSSSWSFEDSTIYGELNYTQFLWNDEAGDYEEISHYIIPGEGNDSYVELTRWFWMSSQMDGLIFIKGCKEARLAEPGQTFLKPAAGTLILQDSNIYGLVQPESIAMVDIENCYIEYTNSQRGWTEQGIDIALKMEDHADGVVANSTLRGNVRAGWSSTNLNLGLAANEFVMRNNRIFDGDIYCYASSSLCLENNELDGVDVFLEGNTTLELVDQQIGNLTIDDGGARDWHLILLELFSMRPAPGQVIYDYRESLELNLDGPGDQGNLSEALKAVFAQNGIELKQGTRPVMLDNVTWVLDNNGEKYQVLHTREYDNKTLLYKDVLNVLLYKKENIGLKLEGSGIEQITSLTQNCTLDVVIGRDSDIGSLNLSFNNNMANVRFEDTSRSISEYLLDTGAGVHLTLVDPASGEIPIKTPRGVVLDVNYFATVEVALNGTPLPGIDVEVAADDFNGTYRTDPEGRVRFEYTYETVTSSSRERIIGEEAQVSVKLYSLSSTGSLYLGSSSAVELKLADISPPQIGSLEHTAQFGSWAMKKTIFFKAGVTDDGVSTVDTVKLFYRIDGGKWKNTSFIKTGDTTYEASIPKQNFAKVEYYVHTSDSLGNTAVTEVDSFEVGREERITLILLFAVPGAVVLIVLVFAAKNRYTQSKYVSNKYTKDRHPNLKGRPDNDKKR